MRYGFELTGQTPLLMHADDLEQADELKAWRDNPDNKDFTVKGDDRSPGWTWQTYMYRDGQHVSMPGDNIMVAIRSAAAQIPFKKQESFKKLSQSGLVILDEHCGFYAAGKKVPVAALTKIRDMPFSQQAKAVKDLGFVLFSKRAKVGQAKHVRVRARFEEWSVRGVIEILNPAITPEILAKMFDIAGSLMGLGDWRPSAPKGPGPFGKFSATLKPSK